MYVPDVGETLDGRYALRERLGDGGTATVFRADDLELERTVAVKVYGPESELSDTSRRQREARALAGLRHPSIVTLFDARLDADAPYLVMEFVDGETLARRLTRGPLSATEARAVGAAAASGLAAAHAAGFVHRDVKPANILLAAGPDSSDARLLDFGIAHSVGASRATSTGSLVGSAVYVSPEQASGGVVSAASDVYSLGLVLIECLTGRPAFSGSTQEVLAARLVRAPSLDDPTLLADAALLGRMTSLDAAERPSAADVAGELAAPAPTRVLPAASADLPTERMAEAAPPAVAPLAPPAARERRRVAPAFIIAGALGSLLIAAAVTAALLAGLPDRSPPAGPSDSPSVVVDVTPTPTPTPTPTDDAPGNSGNAPGKEDKDDKDDKKP